MSVPSHSLLLHMLLGSDERPDLTIEFDYITAFRFIGGFGDQVQFTLEESDADVRITGLAIVLQKDGQPEPAAPDYMALYPYGNPLEVPQFLRAAVGAAVMEAVTTRRVGSRESHQREQSIGLMADLVHGADGYQLQAPWRDLR